MRKPLPHQEKVLKWATGKTLLGLFASMRLGKSLMAIRWAMACDIPKAGPAFDKWLIVCPTTVVHAWEHELSADGFASSFLGKDWADAPMPDEQKFFVTSYSRLRASPGILDIPWHGIILDESTTIKNPKAQITKLLTDKCSITPYKAVLSGEPTPESELELFPQLNFLSTTYTAGYKNFWDWRAECCEKAGWGGWDWKLKKGEDVRFMEAAKAFCIWVTWKDAGLKASPIIRQRREVELPPKVMRQYRRVEKDFYLECQDKEANETIVAMNWCAQIAGGFMEGCEHTAKIDELRDMLNGEYLKEPAVVWFRHTAELKAVRKALKQDGHEVTAIYGARTAAQRKVSYLRFQKNKARIMLIQAKCGQFGLDFSHCDVSIYYSRYYDYDVNNQSEARLNKPGKTRPVAIIDLVAKGTVDEDSYETLRSKKAQVAAFRYRINNTKTRKT